MHLSTEWAIVGWLSLCQDFQITANTEEAENAGVLQNSHL